MKDDQSRADYATRVLLETVNIISCANEKFIDLLIPR